jgi:hypothetical protein
MIKSILILLGITLSVHSYAGDLGSSMRCTDTIENLRVTLDRYETNDDGVFYNLGFRTEGRARAIRQNFLGLVTEEVFEKRRDEINTTCGVGYIHNNIDELDFSGGVVGNKSPVGYGMVIRGSDVIFVHTDTTGYAWEVGGEAGPGERVVGSIDWSTGEVFFDEIVKVGYSTFAKNEVFLNPVLKFTGDSCTINVGYYDADEPPFYPYNCD